jgi:serine/threonine protein kinase
MHLPLGYKIGKHYEIIDAPNREHYTLGQGGFGIVYLVKDIHKLDKLFIIKELFLIGSSFRYRDSFKVDTNGSEMRFFFREIKEDIINEVNLLSKIKNRNIVRAEGFIEENKTIYAIMEYIEGSNLEDYIKNHLFNEDEIINLIKQITHGLKEIHNKSIIHRDIKPSNIMRTNEGIYKLIDFTTSRTYSTHKTTITGFISKGYSPPELEQKEAEIGKYSDIYSFGMTLFKILSAKNPPRPIERLGGDDSEFQIDISNLNCSSNIKNIIKKMTEIEIEDRFQNVEEIERALSPKPIETEIIREERPKKSRRPKRRSKRKKISLKKLLIIFSIIGIFGFGYAYIDNIIGNIKSIFSSSTKEFNQANIEEFIEDFMSLEEEGKIRKILLYFAPKTNYYGRADMSRDAIYYSKRAYYKKWFKRKFELLNINIVKKYSTDNISYCEITREMRWEHTSKSYFKSGIATESITLKEHKNSFEIVSIRNIHNKEDKSISLIESKTAETQIERDILESLLREDLKECKRTSYKGKFFAKRAMDLCKNSSSVLGKAYEARAITQSGDEEEGHSRLKKLAPTLIEKCNQNSIDACNLLGFYYRSIEDYTSSVNYFRRSCNGNSGFGCGWLGFLYKDGKGVEQDYNRALELFSKSCELKYHFGCSSLGSIYYHARGTERDYKKAVKYYNKGCKLGSNFGCSNLGYMYKKGQGVEQDYTTSIKFYKRGCNLGSNFGCYDLGYIYQIGLGGVTKDRTKAKKYYKKACNLDYDRACRRVKSL